MPTLTAYQGQDKDHQLRRETWVQQQLIRTSVVTPPVSVVLGLVLVLIVVGALYEHVPTVDLFTWSAFAAAATLARYLLSFYYAAAGTASLKPGTHPLTRLSRRYTPVWFVLGGIWGSLMLIFFEQVPVVAQFICMLALVGHASYAVRTLAPCQHAFFGFLAGLGASAAASLGADIAERPENQTLYMILGATLLFWLLTSLAGRQLYRVLRDKLELQFDRETLIKSLQASTQKAVDAVATKNRFIATAAHDLRQPVHAMAIYVDWLVQEPDFADEIAPKIQRSVKSLADMFEALFNVAGLESDPLLPSVKDVDLVEIFRDLQAQYLPVAEERAVRLRMRLTDGPCMVRTDPVLLRRLIGNLMSNAFKNTKRGAVMLALRTRGDRWSIEVWDTGVGISKDHQDLIFEEFYRVPLQGTEEGFGLGLAIVTRLSKALDAPVAMASKLGKGSVFKVAIRKSDAY